MSYKILLFCFYCVGGLVFTFTLNLLIDAIAIPDPCYYHENAGGTIFNLMYETPSWNGFHPVPSILNITITIITGLILGYLLAYRKYKKQFPD